MELSTPHSDQPLLLGLAIFQYLHQLEYVRSIHLFKKGGYIHRIQQEFLSKGRSFKERRAPTHLACLSNGAHAKAHMDMVRAKQESESWKCLLDFCTSPPRNPHLDMLVVSVWAKANALFMSANNAHENCAINWEQPHQIVPSLSACLQSYKPTEHEDAIVSPDTTSQRLQLQQWGSDLELASPRISQAFDLTLLRKHTNDANMALYGARSSPMSISLSNNNVDSSSWTHKPLVSTPLMLLNVMEESQLNGEMGRNVTGFACSLVLPNSQFESILGESSTNCNIFGTMPFDCGITQPMSSTSNTYSSSDERSLEAVNSGAPDQLKDDWGGSNGFPKAKESMKFRKSSSARAAAGRVTELTKDELTHYFNMPITQASKELKVGLTVLKKRCRIFGIPRWPHRKMKSINSLINNIQFVCLQDLTKGDGDTDNDASRVQVAVEELEKQKKEMQESPGIQLAERTKRLRQACFKASYRKRRQALNDLSIDDHHNAVMNSSNSNSSNNSSSSNSFYHYCE